MKTTEMIKIFLLGMVAAALLASVWQGAGRAYAGVVNTESRLVVEPGADRGSLFIVSPETKNILYYSADNGRFMLRAVRTYRYDIGLEDENESGGITVKKAEKLYEKMLEEKAKEQRGQ